MITPADIATGVVLGMASVVVLAVLVLVSAACGDDDVEDRPLGKGVELSCRVV